MTAEIANDQLLTCLPAHLRSREPRFSRVAVGMSGAGVYRVDVGTDAYILKIGTGADGVTFQAWEQRVAIQRAAGDAGIAPKVIHVDAERRAVLSELVIDRGVGMLLMNPASQAQGLAMLGATLRRIHAISAPAGTVAVDVAQLLAAMAGGLDGFPIPTFARDALDRVQAATPPASDRLIVLSHNDVNPSNLAFDGERLLLLDWDTAALNEPLYDLASIALFFRFDEATCKALLAAYDGVSSVGELPPRFLYDRTLIAVMCGVGMLRAARRSGHRGDAALALDAAPTMAAIYQAMRTGTLDLRSPDGQWAFGLALIAASYPAR